MKTFKTMLLLMAFSILAISCNDEENDNSQTTEISTKNSLQNRFSASTGINVIYNDKRYELQEDKSVAYFDAKDNYFGDIVLVHNDVEVIDNSSTSGEFILKNPKNNEVVTISNIKYLEDRTIFDVETNTGLKYVGMEVFDSTSEIAKNPIKIIVKAIVAIVTVVAVSTSSGGTQEDCTASMPTKCPPGKGGYAIYDSGWFTTSCEVGCR